MLHCLKTAKKVKRLLSVPNSPPYEELGQVVFNYERTPLDGDIERAYFTLDGEGPFFLIDFRCLKIASKIIVGFEFGGIGSVVKLNGLRLKVVAEYGNGFEFLAMLPDTRAVIFYYLLPIFRWFDMIYRRTILTAVVWNIAACPPSEMPYWGHLKIFKGKSKETKL